MIDFKQLTIDDRTWMEEYLKKADYMGCDYSFGNLFIWRKAVNTMAANVNNALCVMSRSLYDNETVYLYPAGEGFMKPVIEELMKDAYERGTAFKMRGLTKENVMNLEEWFPERFHVQLMRDEFDYIYEVDKMIKLSGKKYHGKRNHIKRFMDADEWHYEDIHDDNINDCRKMNDEWCIQNCRYESDEYKEEQCAVNTAFNYFKELGFKGGVLYQNGHAVAFTVGEPLNSDTFVVHIEKAFQDIQGAYPMINQQFAIHGMNGFRYVNREEDLGIEGLRRAKLSYNPEILLEKYTAADKGGLCRK